MINRSVVHQYLPQLYYDETLRSDEICLNSGIEVSYFKKPPKGDPSIFKIIRSVATSVRMFLIFDLSFEDNTARW
jgi:hypothetical protein